MQTESGNTVQDTEIMINLATKFYQDLFLVEDRHLESFTFVDQFDKKIDETDKVLLEKAFIEDNVYDHSLMINKKMQWELMAFLTKISLNYGPV